MLLLQIPFPEFITPAAFTIPLPDMQLGPIHLGPFPIRWYALGYIFGVVIGWWYAARLATTQKLWGDQKPPVSKADIDDFAFWVMIGILLGGRIGYLLFYTLPFEPEKLLNDPSFALRMWEGGMSFHGGLIGATLAVVYTCWSRKISIFHLGDIACASAPIGIFLVRCANFINAELYGRKTDAPWGMKFPEFDWTQHKWFYERMDAAGNMRAVGSVDVVHPSQLYEAFLEGALLFSVLAVLIWRFGALKRPGLVSGVFLVGYAIFRTFVENFREPDSFVHGLPSWLTMGMMLSIPMLLGGLFLIYRANRTPKPA